MKNDFENLIEMLKDKEKIEIKNDENDVKKVIFNEFGMVFDRNGNYLFSFNFKW